MMDPRLDEYDDSSLLDLADAHIARAKVSQELGQLVDADYHFARALDATIVRLSRWPTDDSHYRPAA